MKVTQVRQLSKYLLPHLPDYTQSGMVLHSSSVKHVLRGFYFEDSGFDASAFYVWVFFLPLYIPTTTISFNFGKRLGSGSGTRWTLSTPRLHDELLEYILLDGLEFLKDKDEPSKVAIAVRKLGPSSGLYGIEAIAYSEIMSENVIAGLTALDKLTSSLDRSIRWQAEMMDRATRLKMKLSVSLQDAKQLLTEWEQSSLKNLGLQSAI
jgi:hypothetical protein